jgi:hypothetical protein
MKKLILLLSVLFVVSCESDYAPIKYTLTTQVTPDEGGSVFPSTGEYTDGNQVTVQATPSQYFEFVKWGGDGNGSTNNPLSVTINSNITLIAEFVDNSKIIIGMYQYLGGNEGSHGSWESDCDADTGEFTSTHWKFQFDDDGNNICGDNIEGPYQRTYQINSISSTHIQGTLSADLGDEDWTHIEFVFEIRTNKLLINNYENNDLSEYAIQDIYQKL